MRFPVSEPIVVTGAAGLVGRAVCAALHDRGGAILSVTRSLAPSAAGDLIELDLATGDLSALVPRAAAVVHLAAAVPHSVHYPDSERSAALTRQIDANVLKAVGKWACPVIYMSSCGLYDRRLETVKRESDVASIRVESPYFAAKLVGEELFARKANATIMRLAAPLGPGLKAAVVAARFIEQARAGAPIELWGSGRREQNFVDVEDVSALILAALCAPVPAVINVASAQPTTMAELAEAVIRAVGRGSVAYAPKADPRDGEIARYSIELAAELFGWRPQLGLMQSLRKLVNENFES